MTVCSSAFQALGRAQAAALGYANLPIALVPHPFGILTRGELNAIAEDVAGQLAALVSSISPVESGDESAIEVDRARIVDVDDDIEAVNRLLRERRWSDGFPAIPPTAERVDRMLANSSRSRYDVIARIAPAFGAATVERIAINAVLAGCEPGCVDLLIAAIQAVAAPEFNIQGIQATTNPAAVWMIVNGPIARRLNINGGSNCLGQGAWANASLGRALRLIMQNIGGAYPGGNAGDMDRATHGQPGKFSMCCAENEAESPWPPVHAERGFAPGESVVTVVGFSGTLNMNSHTKSADDLLRAIANSMAYATSNDYWCGGEPWIVVSPEHAAILAQAGFDKAAVRRELWAQSKMRAAHMAAKDFERTQRTRHGELGDIEPGTELPITAAPEQIGIVVAGGAGTHSVYIPGFGNSRSVSRRIAGREVTK